VEFGLPNQEVAIMKCVLCKHGEARPGKVRVTLDRGATTVIIKDVPGDVCENCGEYYLSEGVTARVLAMAEEAVAKGAEVEIIRYATGNARKRAGVASD
jgi:YgiT-type zinc finger domain-containing protein